MLSDAVLRDELTKDALASRLDFKFETFTDNHMHLDPRNGEGLEAVKKFQQAGGKYIFLVCKTTRDMGLTPLRPDSFEKLYEHTARLARKVKEDIGVRAHPVIGVHPAEVVEMCGELSFAKAVKVALKALKIAGDKVKEGEAVAIGEVGKPHFEVEPEVAKACDEVLRFAFQVAKEADCSVQVHAPNEKGLFQELGRMAEEAKIDPKRVIKHYSTSEDAPEAGVYPSIMATEGNVTKARGWGNRFLMESDYIDDLRRPGAVVGPKSVPRVSKKLVSQGILSEEDLWKIHVDNIEDAYGIILE